MVVQFCVTGQSVPPKWCTVDWSDVSFAKRRLMQSADLFMGTGGLLIRKAIRMEFGLKYFNEPGHGTNTIFFIGDLRINRFGIHRIFPHCLKLVGKIF
jgi:hypothetical protein